MRTVTLNELIPALERFATKNFGAGCAVADVRSMESGHAGLTFGFDVKSSKHGVRGFIIRLAPIGVRRHGNTDVYRQSPLLNALHAAGLPVPRVPFSSPTEDEFGAPYIVMERLRGRTFFICDPDPAFDLSPRAVAPLWTRCVETLAEFHRLDWRRHVSDWDAPRPASEELLRWDKILEKTPDANVKHLGRQVRDLLLDRLPSSGRIGLVHGDYQPGNTLYDNGRVTGIIDWELASIGELSLDLGWVMMLADPENWVDDWKSMAPVSPRELRSIYEEKSGTLPDNLTWSRALAGYKLGAIAGMNVHLHRSGRRPDSVWEGYARAAPNMFRRAEALLRGASE